MKKWIIGLALISIVSAAYADKNSGKAHISSYCATCDKSGVFANGEKFHAGGIAADRMYKFGTKIYIKGYGTFTVCDRGGAIKGAGRFDIYMPNGCKGPFKSQKMNCTHGTGTHYNVPFRVIK